MRVGSGIVIAIMRRWHYSATIAEQQDLILFNKKKKKKKKKSTRVKIFPNLVNLLNSFLARTVNSAANLILILHVGSNLKRRLYVCNMHISCHNVLSHPIRVLLANFKIKLKRENYRIKIEINLDSFLDYLCDEY